jgi:hypothetical protein
MNRYDPFNIAKSVCTPVLSSEPISLEKIRSPVSRGNIRAVALFIVDRKPAAPSFGKSRLKPGTFALAKLLAKSNFRSFSPVIALRAV